MTDAAGGVPGVAGSAGRDGYDRRLIEHVRPPDWTNPSPRDRYHLVVIGAGTAGLVTAAIAASLGATVALIERDRMGGDCLNTGCVPSKALLAAARGWDAARRAADSFGGPPVTGEGDFAAVMERMRRLRAEIAPVDGAPRFRGLGVDVFFGDARFVAADAIEVAGARLRFRRAVVAVGARAYVPPIPGLANAGHLTNETIFDLERRPDRLCVIGAGPIGCEMAQAFARFGSRVTLIECADRVLPKHDPDASVVVTDALRRDGVQVVAGASVTQVAAEGDGVAATRRLRYTDATGGGEIVADAILVAAGRVANVEGLGLDAAGVRTGRSGIEIDDRLRTANPRVYAIGDVASSIHFTHAADAQARMVVRNALFRGRERLSRLMIPSCVYTSPEIACVGNAMPGADRTGPVDTITIPLAEVDRARLDGRTEGFFRVHLRRGGDRIVGATLVAPDAGDIISQITTAMVSGLGLSALGRAIYPYPTIAEVIRKAADAHARTRLTPSVARLFRFYFGLTARGKRQEATGKR